MPKHALLSKNIYADFCIKNYIGGLYASVNIMCVCVYLYIYIHTQIHTHTHIYMYIADLKVIL